MKNKTANFVLKGATTLTIAALVGKILSAIYRVPFQNLVGNRGFYIYQQIYPIYGIAMTIGLTGFPVYISKIIAKETSDTKKKQQATSLLKILFLFGILVFAVLYLEAAEIAQLMGDNKLEELIKCVSWLYLLVPLLSVARGYNQGMQEMMPTAFSQLVEQMVRICIIIVAALFGIAHGWSLYRIGSYAFLGSIVGAICALAFFTSFFKELLKSRHKENLAVMINALKGLLSEGLIICLFAGILVLLQLVDSFTLKKALQTAGYSMQNAENLKGVYDRSQTFLQLGLVISTSFSTSLLPMLIKNQVERDKIKFEQNIQLIYRICIWMSMSVTVGLIILMPSLNKALFSSEQGSTAISISMLTIIFAGIILLDNSILQSTNNYKKNIIVLVSIILIKFLTNYQFTLHMGIVGAALSSVLSMAIGTFLSGTSLKKIGLSRKLNKRFMVRVIGCSIIMTVTVFFILNVLNLTNLLGNSRVGSFIQCIIGVLTGAIFYVGATRYGNLFSEKEWRNIPGGEYVLKIFRKRMNK
ncbi:putative polysaccharide biosynthesis protein [Liquorilactobacillus mali]|uniref:putative polysaccharide biosynthesis protein n=1 Tax=Liquorilactobacillus mali TaxID=1618 RepID=UPI000249254E|nr:polysaccharide biosynthesis protein [Liquorilactobacillus mali]EJF01985.1 polysaccharide transporter [Liquorilactobacillus mali KCTC 3596 = DSM 20444]MDC7953726.1 polysaccharide biosynthesis protein [Liquorilactobacillus mali]